MSWISSLFLNPYQKALPDPRQYREPFDAAVVIDEIQTGKAGQYDPESKSSMIRAARQFLDEGRPLTIERLALDAGDIRRALPHPDRGIQEFAVLAALGCDLLAGYLVRRANLIAKGIKPGADAVLADAFGVSS